jgi:hypothetical protein
MVETHGMMEETLGTITGITVTVLGIIVEAHGMTEETLGTIIGITMETLGTMEIGSNVERLYG